MTFGGLGIGLNTYTSVGVECLFWIRIECVLYVEDGAYAMGFPGGPRQTAQWQGRVSFESIRSVPECMLDTIDRLCVPISRSCATYPSYRIRT